MSNTGEIGPPKVAIGCQGGGVHGAFEAGVLVEILKDVEKSRFKLVGLSGTSAGALCALMVWYGLASKNGRPGSEREAIDRLNRFWNGFAASTPAERILNLFSYGALKAKESELLGAHLSVSSLNPFSVISQAVTASLPLFGIREQFFDFQEMLAEACPEFDCVDWENVTTRLLLGASEVINGFETVFDTDINKKVREAKIDGWRQQLPLTLSAVAASGTLPAFREAEPIEGGYYWDGLYSQNPPVRQFFAHMSKEETPDELWIVRINPQQWPELPRSSADIIDRENELMGNLSLNKELDFILKVNEWLVDYPGVLKDKKRVIVRTIKMKERTADELRYSSKFDRRRGFINQLREEGRTVARDWLNRWPHVGCYPCDAAYRERR